MSGQRPEPRTQPRWWPSAERLPFTSAARDALDDAELLATTRTVPTRVPPALLLWAVLRRKNKNGRLGLAVLEACGVDCVSLEREIEEALPAGSGSGQPLRDFRDLYTVAVRAHEEALLLNHNWVGTEHLVLALFSTGDALITRLFEAHGVTAEAFKQTLNELLRG